MKRFLLASGIGFITSQVTGALIALFVLQPLVNERLQPHIRSHEEGLNGVSLGLGYLVFATGIAFLLPRLNIQGTWIRRGCFGGFLLGLMVFFGGHLVIGGWSRLDAPSMALSGFLDAFAGLAAGISVGFIYRKDF